jgi:hypothetical protein
MNNNTNKKKLELRKTAIANLTLSEEQMKIIKGGGGKDNPDSSGNFDDDTNCTGHMSWGHCPGVNKKTL